MLKAAAVQRAERFSPNSVEADRLILEAVAGKLGLHYIIVGEEGLRPGMADVYVSMARTPEALALLEEEERRGAVVVNSPGSVHACDRAAITATMGRLGTPIPPPDGPNGVWIKRAHGYTERPEDTAYCPTKADAYAARLAFASRGAGETMQCAHIVGDLVKFYGSDSFFRCYHAADKLGMERANGPAQGHSFDAAAIARACTRVAGEIGISAWGGDAIISPGGAFHIIDFNDWPSFSRCRMEAAEAIANSIRKRL